MHSFNKHLVCTCSEPGSGYKDRIAGRRGGDHCSSGLRGVEGDAGGPGALGSFCPHLDQIGLW